MPMRILRSILISTTVLLPTVIVASPIQAAGRVHLELVGEGRGASLVFQEWAALLGKAGIRNVRIRNATATDRVGIEVRGTKDNPLYVVTGVIRSRNELILPSGRFRRSDVARLARRLDDLARLGPADRREPPAAFGLSTEQIEQVLEDLSRPVGFSTVETVRRAAVERIGDRLLLPFKIEPAMADALDDKVSEELFGISRGTALAYLLRPAGMCLAPRELNGRVVYVAKKCKPGMEIWPVGREPNSPIRELLPAIYEFHNVNIQNVPAARAMAAIGKLLKVPVLIDHDALARHGIEPAKVLVTHPRRRTTYSIALRKILFQAGLKFEVRADDTGEPFLWISTVKPV